MRLPVTLVILLGCSLGPAWADEPFSLAKPQTQAVIKAVSDHLKDPYSAKFGPMAATASKGLISICGTVNAKNSYGGYVGSTPYYAIMPQKPASKAMLMKLGGAEDDSAIVFQMCGDAGISMR